MKSRLLYRRIIVSFALVFSILAVHSGSNLLSFSPEKTEKKEQAAAKKSESEGTNEEITPLIQVEAVIPFLKIDLNNDLLSELKPVFFELKERRFYTSVPLFTSTYFRNLFTCCIPINAP